MRSPRHFMLVAGLIAAANFGWLTRAAADENKDGWRPLFNGKSLDGWYVFLKDQNEKNKDPNHLVQVDDGAVHMYKDAEANSQQPFGYLATDQDHANYHLRL